MQHYDFSSLDDKDFEILVCHLLGASQNTRFERFKPGRDAGVDGRYFATAKGEVVLQCKHWVRSSVQALIRRLEKDEVSKAARLGPSRYIFATSLSLSRKDKSNIARLFGGLVRFEADIFGQEDLNDLLAAFPAIERNHYKLWIASTGVMERVLHASILGRSEFQIRSIQKRAHLYVETTHYRQAAERLSGSGVILITGEPGIGKTTLAEQLCLNHALQDFEVCVLSDAIEEAEAIFNPVSLQLFYFDDFLGRNYLEALGRHEDSKIMSFIKRIVSDKRKRFILTSRTTILNQGKSLSDLFGIGRLEKSEFEITVSSLTDLEKARILYSHFWHSELPTSFLEEVLIDRRYRKIIAHESFNPRLIQFITDSQRIPTSDPLSYWSHIEGTLERPEAVWQHVYDSQLDDYGRLLLQLVVLSGGEISEVLLCAACRRFLSSGSAQGFRGRGDFTLNLRVTVGSVLNRTSDRGGVATISLFNPSIGDYVLGRIAGDEDCLRTRMIALSSVASCSVLRALIKNEIVPISAGLAVVAEQIRLTQGSDDLNFRVVVGHLAAVLGIEQESVREVLRPLIMTIRSLPSDFTQYAKLCELLRRAINEEIVQPDKFESVIEEVIGREPGSFDELDLASMARLRQFLPDPEGTRFEEFLRPVIVDFWENSISEHVAEQRLLADLFDESEQFQGEEIVRAEVKRILEEYGLQFSPVQVSTIGEWVDVNDVILSNQQNSGNDRDYEEFRRDYSTSGPDAIDDLFNVDLPKE